MKTTILISLFILLGASSSALAQTRSTYVGYKYKGVLPGKTLPNGVKHFGGGLVSDPYKDPVYGISDVARGRTKMLWLEISTGSNAQGVTGWEVKDVLSFPNFTSSRYLFFSMDPSVECTRNKKPVENLVAIGRVMPKQGIFKPERAWIPNLTTEKFDETTIQGLKCIYSEP